MSSPTKITSNLKNMVQNDEQNMIKILNKITPYLVFWVLIIYILNGYKVIHISEIIFNRAINTKLSGESNFIDFFYFVFTVAVLCVSSLFYLFTNLKIVNDNAKINLFLRLFLILEFWYLFGVSNLFILKPFSGIFWFFSFLLIVASVYIFIIYAKEKQQNTLTLSYVGHITFVIIFGFYLSVILMYFNLLKYETGFTALYTPVLYIPLLLSAVFLLRNSKNYFIYVLSILVVPSLIIALYQHNIIK